MKQQIKYFWILLLVSSTMLSASSTQIIDSISIYHNLLMFKIIPEKLSPCVQGIPCSVDYLNWLGFITIPLLSFFSYTCILILLIMSKRKNIDAK